MHRQKPLSTLLTVIGTGIFLGISVAIYFFVINPRQEDTLPSVASFAIQSSVTPNANLIEPDTFPHIMIAAAQVDGLIVPAHRNAESWEIDHLGMNVGHLEGTAWINEPGNIVLAGHVELADGRPGIFAKVEHVQPGDIVVLTEKGIEYRYVVTEVKKVDPTDISVVAPTEKPRITLITCSDYDFSSNIYETRLIVVAELI